MVLGGGSWYEKDDLCCREMDGFIDGFKGGIEGLWEWGWEWDIYKSVSKAV
ncbi:hypothetical protein [Staphylococcus epidermidis]|uniref:hypothetical protein n=1 Tax=Staphylococcus epidermidis TaxID=1282 RepID=UPI001642826A|nr:hypothetical protein [Staphylococcus epidermidis]